MNNEEPMQFSVKQDKKTEMRKPFPYWPQEVPVEELMRMEVMIELNKWANNDPFMAKRSAETLILLLSDQFSINLMQLEK